MMRIAVVGAGGVGGYFGGRLAQAGEEIIFIARGEHLQAMRRDGLKVDSVVGDFTVHPVQATDDPAEVGIVDVVLLGVKAWQVTEAAQAMRPMIGPESFVVPLLNGVEAPSLLARVLGPEHVLGGLCGIASSVAGPGHIRHMAADPFVYFGELTNRRSERAERLLQAFAGAAGVSADISPDIGVAMWRKFLFIVAWGGLGAVTRSPVGTFRSLEQTRRMLQQVMQEVFDVAQAHSIALPQHIVGQEMERIDGLPPDVTASMQRDILGGRPSELTWQTGAVVRLGQEVGVETPVNAFIYHSLLPQELRARGQVKYDI